LNHRRDVHGILLLDKPKGVTSNFALQMVKRLFRARKAGHTGSLDPVAEGLLPICLGEATKFSRFLLESDKHYQVVAKLGIRTTTGDSEGESLSEKPVSAYSLSAMEKALDHFRGEILQTPPMYSAVKQNGQPLYWLARQGLTVERQARTVSIHHLELLALTEDCLSLEVRASKGTYIRTLIDDLGEWLGCGAHIIKLTRLGAGPYSAQQMVGLNTLEQLASTEGAEALDQYLLPMDSSVASMPDVVLCENTAYYLCRGQAVTVPYAPTAGWVRLTLKNHQFIGVGEILDDGRVAPRRLTQEVVSL